MGTKLAFSYYQGDDVVMIARNKLGKVLYTYIDNKLCAGIITETEAYRGYDDRACHSHNNRKTPRTEIMFGVGGYAYIFVCYGLHIMFNIVTNDVDCADAILVCAIHPTFGIEYMKNRIGKTWNEKYSINGPGKVTKALGISKDEYACDLTGDRVWIEDEGINYHEDNIIVGPRVGIEYAHEDALLPRRFRIQLKD